MITSGQLDEIAIKYNKNKDKYTHDLWFEKIKEWANGVNNTKRRSVSVSSCHKRDNGTYKAIGRSRLHGTVRDNKTETNKLPR